MSQKVTQLIVDKKFDDDYIKIDKHVFTKVYAYSIFGENLNNHLDPGKPKEELIFKTFPSNEKMLEEINKSQEEIFEELEINKLMRQENNLQIVLRLNDYFAKNLSYDMSLDEENKDEQNDIDLETLMFNGFREAISVPTYRNNIIRLYSALVDNRGVCDDYSLSFIYLLERANITAFFVGLENPQNTKFRHALIFVKHVENGKSKGYYAIDVTKNVADYLFENKTLNYFAPDFKEYQKTSSCNEICELRMFNGFDEENCFVSSKWKDDFEQLQNNLLDVNTLTEEIQKYNPSYKSQELTK